MTWFYSIHGHVWQSGACQAVAAQAVAVLLIIHRAQPPLHGRAGRTQLPHAPSIVWPWPIPGTHAQGAMHNRPHTPCRRRTGQGSSRGWLGVISTPPPACRSLHHTPPRGGRHPHIPGYGLCHGSAILPFAERSPPSTSSTPNSPNRALSPSVHSSPGGAMAREAGVSPQPRVGGCPLDRNSLWVPHRPSDTGTLSGHAPERSISPRTGASSWQISCPAASKRSHHRPTVPTGLPRHLYEQYSGHSQKDTGAVEGDSRSVKSRRS